MSPSIWWFVGWSSVAVLASALVWYDQHRCTKRNLEPLGRMRKHLEELQRGLRGRGKG